MPKRHRYGNNVDESLDVTYDFPNCWLDVYISPLALIGRGNMAAMTLPKMWLVTIPVAIVAVGTVAWVVVTPKRGVVLGDAMAAEKLVPTSVTRPSTKADVDAPAATAPPSEVPPRRRSVTTLEREASSIVAHEPESDAPPDSAPEIPTSYTLVLENPTEYSVGFAVLGRVEWIAAGETRSFTHNVPCWTLRMHRGSSFGEAIEELDPGTYQFTVYPESGWQLDRQTPE